MVIRVGESNLLLYGAKHARFCYRKHNSCQGKRLADNKQIII